MRTEYPNPQFQRDNYQVLNGEWDFAFDDDHKIFKAGKLMGDLTEKIQVPFAYQTEASGIFDHAYHPYLVYRKWFSLEENMRDKDVMLKFNAVDFRCVVYLNGTYIGEHVGGYSRFEFDITSSLREENELILYVEDEFDPAQPRGKQYWKEELSRCWYNATSGIYQSVYLEAFHRDRFKRFHMDTDIDRNEVRFDILTEYGIGKEVEIEISYRGVLKKKARVTLDEGDTKFALKLQEEDDIEEIHYWDLNQPNLYDVKARLLDGEEVLDEAKTYFGFREIHTDESGSVFLNHKKLYQRLILDQGYFDKGDLTALDVEDYKKDILLAKAMGFNGARKHQKIEDPYFYYYADQLGFIVWAEIPSAYRFSYEEIRNISQTIGDTIDALYNHPSIITWVPFNESWGIRKALIDKNQQSFVRSMYHLIKSLDSTRLVDSNDGWEQVSETDFIAIHDYESTGDAFPQKYSRERIDTVQPMGRRLMAYGERSESLPVLLTEYGGLSYESEVQEKFFGYHIAKDKEALLEALEHLQKNVYDCAIAGFCYTQLTDVKQETNGLLDKCHKPKFDLERVRKIILNEK